jgi:hypothetical protein
VQVRSTVSVADPGRATFGTGSVVVVPSLPVEPRSDG